MGNATILDTMSKIHDIQAKKGINMRHASGALIALFIFGFGLHAAMSLALDGKFSLPLGEGPMRAFAIVGLLIAIMATWRNLLALDEVERGFALKACGYSFAATATLSYLATPASGIGIAVGHSIWAVALTIWLACYAFLQWRAR